MSELFITEPESYWTPDGEAPVLPASSWLNSDWIWSLSKVISPGEHTWLVWVNVLVLPLAAAWRLARFNVAGSRSGFWAWQRQQPEFLWLVYP